MSNYTDKPWLASYTPGVPPSIDYPDIPLHDFLKQSAEKFPQKSAILFQDGGSDSQGSTVTYQQLDELSSRFAAALVERGVSRGDRVSYFMQNCPELVIAFYGILKAGAVPAPCNPMYKEDELTHQLEDTLPTVVVCDADRYPLLQSIYKARSFSNIVVVGDVPSTLSFEDLLARHKPLAEPVPANPTEDMALLPYTGGTTGVSKGAMLTHRNLVVNAMQFATWYRYEIGEEVFISTLPLFHIGGITGAMSVPISVAGTMVLFRRFDAARVMRAIQEHRATRFLGVPTMYIAALGVKNAHSYDLSSLRPCRTSASSLPPAVKREFDDLVGHEVLIEGYGLTETAPLTHANPVHKAKEGSIGLPLPNTEARIVDADLGVEDVPVGEVGELLLRGPQVMAGYWRKPNETSDAVRDGWFYTGDLAWMDEEGYFYIVDRKKDVINASGFKVWPREVEEVLFDHAKVKMAAVVGVADSYRGETVKAILVLKEEIESSQENEVKEELLRFCRERLAAFKVPRILEFRDSLPVSAAGKVLRREMRD